MPAGRDDVCAVAHRLKLQSRTKVVAAVAHRCFVSNNFHNGNHSRNLLLSSLSNEDYARVSPHLHPVALGLGDILGRTAGELTFAYFPTTCVVSLICEMEDGATAEVALTGNDGVLGTSLFLGGNTTTNRAIVGIAGEAQRMDARVLRDQFTRGGAFQRVLLRYTEGLITQISLTAACNRMHTLEKRLCRWLLLLHDRATCNEFVMTQEFIANMLGGRRETVTVAAGRLQDAGFIHYTRGRLKIVDRKGLENSACECYRAVRSDGPRLLPPKNVETSHCLRESPPRTRVSNVLS
jgi:Crp-like helix-turn-helix domain